MAATIPPTVLLTRPKAASERFAQQLGLPCLISPLMQTVWLEPSNPPYCDALVFTSETGVAAWARLHKKRGTAYCVGDRTAATARKVGFEARSAGGDVNDLMELLKSVPHTVRLLHVRGQHVAADMGAHVVPYIAYEQQPCPLSRDALDLLSGSAPVVVPFFSPRSVALFQSAAPEEIKAPLSIAAISPAVATAVAAAGLGKAVIAAHPNADEMLRVIRSIAQDGSSA